MKTIVCIATGPSVTPEQVQVARDKGFTLFACNNAYQLAPDAALLYCLDYKWWSHFWPEVKDLPAEKWTVNERAAKEFGINLIAEKNARGLSTDPSVIHHGHGGGYTLVGLAYRAGAERIILLGYDCKFAPDYDGKARDIGSSPRHFFGEYPAHMQHWPSVMVKGGVHIELVDLYRSIAEQGLVEIVNCTPGSAIDCFPQVNIESL